MPLAARRKVLARITRHDGAGCGYEHRVNQGKPASGSLGLAALVSTGIGGMVSGVIFSVLGLTAQIACGGAYLSFVVGGIVAAR